MGCAKVCRRRGMETLPYSSSSFPSPVWRCAATLQWKDFWARARTSARSVWTPADSWIGHQCSCRPYLSPAVQGAHGGEWVCGAAQRLPGSASRTASGWRRIAHKHSNLTGRRMACAAVHCRWSAAIMRRVKRGKRAYRFPGKTCFPSISKRRRPRHWTTKRRLSVTANWALSHPCQLRTAVVPMDDTSAFQGSWMQARQQGDARQKQVN